MKKAAKASDIRRPGRKRWGCKGCWPVLVLVIVGIGLVPACGKKGPPFLPDKRTGLRAERLTGSMANGEIRLEGIVAGAGGQAEAVGCRISHAWYPEDRLPCEGCPIPMTEIKGDVDFRPSGARFACSLPVAETRGVWFIEVRLIDKSGAVGPASERIRIQAQK